MYERLLSSVLAKGKKSLLLLGPRQVGKSTLLKSLAPDFSLNFAEPGAFRAYVSRPERLGEELEAADAKVKTVLLDEVQRVPPILDLVQYLSDERPGRFRFLLSGSSARTLKRGQANLLPGRIHVHHLHPLLARELGGEFNLDRAMAHGTLPGMYRETDSNERSRDLLSYVDTYLKEEIQAEALVRDVGAYGRRLELAAACSGRILNLNSLCRDAGIRYETARRYMDVLQETLIAFPIPAWSGADRASLVAHPKIFLFDLGVRNALLRRPLDRPLEDEKGILFEHLVAYELHRRLGTLWPEAKVTHFRNRHGSEVDFVLEIGRETWGIEVKAGKDSEGFKVSGFSALAERVPKLKRRIVVFLGKRKQVRAGVEFIPFADFQNELPPV
jgi:predicted AAA+ superfamily ATPase